MEPRRFSLSRLAGLPLLAMTAADGVQGAVRKRSNPQAV